MENDWLKTSFEGWTFHHSAPLTPTTRPILALHGFTGSGCDFRQLSEHPEAPADTCWIAPDLPGHGDTGVLPRAECSLNAMADVLSRFLESQKLEPHLLGYSMGGRLALTLATQGAPIASLTLIGAHPGIIDESERQQRRCADHELALHIREIGSVAFAEEWELKPLIRSQCSIPQPYLDGLKTRRRRQSAEGLARCLEEAGTGTMAPLWDSLKSIQYPILYLFGAEDIKFRAIGHSLAAVCKKFKSGELPNAGHCAHLENSLEFLTKLKRCITTPIT